MNKKFHNYDELRDGITEAVKNCSDNVRVVIYIDDVLDEPIFIGIGAQENHLIISIRNNGKVEYRWTKETWSKVFRDALEGV